MIDHRYISISKANVTQMIVYYTWYNNFLFLIFSIVFNIEEQKTIYWFVREIAVKHKIICFFFASFYA